MNFELEDSCNASKDLDSFALPHTPKKETPVVGSNSQHEDPAIVHGMFVKRGSVNPNFSSYIIGLEATNLQAAAIISISEKTNRVLDHFGIADSVIPRLRKLVCTVRSSRWEEVLHSPEWGLTSTQAKTMSKALLADISQEITKEKVRFHFILHQQVLIGS